ncbi:MAG TPA: helix-turn-helix domain-containing protein [Terriglobales bacterium]|nr:helix-turn-helix domain-containing protein [Terriglobales bacterium]
MARKDQAAELLRQGCSPTQIAQQMRTTPAAVMQYLCVKIGEGELRRSDIAFSLPPETRTAIEEAIKKTGSTSAGVVGRELRKRGIRANRVDVGIYIHYRRARVVLGDMYELVRTVEVRLHSFLKQAFITEFGEEQWWRSGVPDNIRADCAALLEKDPEPADEPYCYTHLINLREILDKRWSVLTKYMPKALLNQKKELLDRITKLNRIRNSVMHPVRNAAPSESDFEFVRDLERDLADLRVHNPAEKEEVPLAEAIEAAEQGSAPHELVTTITDANAEETPPQEEVA